MGLVYRMFPESPEVNDVVKRELQFSVDSDVSVLEVPVSAGFLDLPPVKDGAQVILRLRDTDNAENVSDWSITFTARDTLIPPAPGFKGVKLVSEVPDPVKPEVSPEREEDPEVLPEPPPEVVDDENFEV